MQATLRLLAEDMQDLYFLTGLKLPAPVHTACRASFARQGLRMQFSDLDATSGRSDIRGTVLIDAIYQSLARRGRSALAVAACF